MFAHDSHIHTADTEPKALKGTDFETITQQIINGNTV